MKQPFNFPLAFTNSKPFLPSDNNENLYKDKKAIPVLTSIT